MPSYICHNCQHELKTDEQTLLYLISRPPKCTRCGYVEADLREAKNKQFFWQIKKKGMRRTARLFDALYHTGRTEAVLYLQRISGVVTKQRSSTTATGVKKRRFPSLLVIIIVISSSAGFIPLFVELLSGPPEYCKDLVYVPGEDGGSVWSLHSVGTDEHKIKVKVFGLPDGELLIKKKIETEFPLSTGTLLHQNGKVWILGNSYMDQSMIYILNENDAGVLMNTSQFINSEGRLKSGLAQLQYFPPYSLGLTAKDGDFLFYNIQHDRYFSSHSEFVLFSDSLNKQSGYFDLENDPLAGHVSRLFYITIQPQNKQKEYSNRDYKRLKDYFTDNGVIVHKMLSQRNFLDAEVVYADQAFVVLKHKNELGSNAKILYSAFDKSGKMTFEVAEEELYPEETDTDNNYMLTASRYVKVGNLFVIHYNTYGICGIDIGTGEIAWSLWFTE
jgi:hypothetical protein